MWEYDGFLTVSIGVESEATACCSTSSDGQRVDWWWMSAGSNEGDCRTGARIRAVELPKVVMFDVDSVGRRMHYCEPGLNGEGGI